jgi:hypothetical protein
MTVAQNGKVLVQQTEHATDILFFPGWLNQFLIQVKQGRGWLYSSAGDMSSYMVDENEKAGGHWILLLFNDSMQGQGTRRFL